jgi:cell fate (sporulation/competence/biofilm development) regulator YmcA (YheA/YmcA/DUF963 family)
MMAEDPSNPTPVLVEDEELRALRAAYRRKLVEHRKVKEQLENARKMQKEKCEMQKVYDRNHYGNVKPSKHKSQAGSFVPMK